MSTHNTWRNRATWSQINVKVTAATVGWIISSNMYIYYYFSCIYIMEGVKGVKEEQTDTREERERSANAMIKAYLWVWILEILILKLVR